MSSNNKKRKMIGEYIVGDMLGQGSFCKVKSVTHQKTGKQFAIKILKPTFKQLSLKEIERELQILNSFRHPNIVSLNEVLFQDTMTSEVRVSQGYRSMLQAKTLYLIVDLAPSGTLFDFIYEKGRLKETAARSIFRQIISGVEYMHAHCVAHRDLKPENILMDGDVIKLNDFGLSNFIEPEGRMKTFCGSPIYAAPEVMKKSVYSGSKADVWSLGIILYVMVTCMLPWRLSPHSKMVENIEDLLEGRFDIPPDCFLSNECVALLERMIVADPLRRATIDEVRKHPWVNKGCVDYPPRHLEPCTPVTEVDHSIVKQMESMGYMSARLCQDVMKNKVKPSVTIYHTLLSRKQFHLSPSGNSSQMLHSHTYGSSISPSPRSSPLGTIQEHTESSNCSINSDFSTDSMNSCITSDDEGSTTNTHSGTFMNVVKQPVSPISSGRPPRRHSLHSTSDFIPPQSMNSPPRKMGFIRKLFSSTKASSQTRVISVTEG